MATTTSAVSEIVFFADVVSDVYNNSLLFREKSSPPSLLETAVMQPDSPSSTSVDMIMSALSPNQSGLFCVNLMQRPENLAIHRNIAAWVAVSLAAIGIVGNIFSLFVLFRTHPHSPTDVYMMHLAAYDVAYEIFFAIVIASRTWWSNLRGSFSFVLIALICRPLIDVFSNLATIVVTVFAMERLLAVYRPLKILNTSANKRVLWIALGTATAITLPDFFEFFITELYVTPSVYPSVSPTTISVSMMDNSTALITIPFSTLSNLTRLLKANGNGNESAMNSGEMFETVVYDGDFLVTTANNHNNFISPSISPVIADNATKLSFYCYYRNEFALSQFYNAYVYFYTAVFTFIPLLLLIFANGFLIWGVARAAKNRRSLTKGQHAAPAVPATTPNGGRGSFDGSADPHHAAKMMRSHQADQQRLTLMLVMIVLIFTVCQLPIAILAICSLLNQQVILGDVFRVLIVYSNILVIVFSTTNFAFYSAFSRRFRQTLTEMIVRLKQAIHKKSIRLRDNARTSTTFASSVCPNKRQMPTTPVTPDEKRMLIATPEEKAAPLAVMEASTMAGYELNLTNPSKSASSENATVKNSNNVDACL